MCWHVYVAGWGCSLATLRTNWGAALLSSGHLAMGVPKEETTHPQSPRPPLPASCPASCPASLQLECISRGSRHFPFPTWAEVRPSAWQSPDWKDPESLHKRQRPPSREAPLKPSHQQRCCDAHGCLWVCLWRHPLLSHTLATDPKATAAFLQGPPHRPAPSWVSSGLGTDRWGQPAPPGRLQCRTALPSMSLLCSHPLVSGQFGQMRNLQASQPRDKGAGWA